MEGTRQSIFDAIDQWLVDTDAPNVFSLIGCPGSGKSTIASSLVSKLTERRRLGSSFAFKRGDVTLSDPTTVWRTVAYDLARYDTTFAEHLVDVLKKGSVDLGRPDIALHFKYLIQQPLVNSYNRSPPHAIPIIVIDALDECGSDSSQVGQRRMLLDTIRQWSSFPAKYKLIITGRDDRVPDSLRAICKQVSLRTGAEVSEDANKDIRLFFEIRFAEFGDCLSPGLIQRGRVIATLTARAAGLFIWAETVVRFMEQGVHDERLQRILRGDMGRGDNITKLYRQILEFSFQAADNYTLKTFNRVVSTIVLAKIPLHEDDLPQFISQPRSSVKSILSKLSSVISTGDDKRLRISHLSFSEFLCDPDRCPEQFCIRQKEESHVFSMACFRLMQDGLKFNICELETSCLLNREVDSLSQRIKDKVGGALLYSCRFWGAHLADTIVHRYCPNSLMTEVKEFVYTRLLFWLEVMSLTNDLAVANITLLTVALLIKVSTPLLTVVC